jgi:hypothetical protein
MHEKHPIEKALKIEAEQLSARYGSAPVVILVGGVGVDTNLMAASF